jgi:hypothetical protein
MIVMMKVYLKIVADKLNLDLNVVMPTYEDFLKQFDVIYTQEEPLVVPRCLWDGMFSEGQRIELYSNVKRSRIR